MASGSESGSLVMLVRCTFPEESLRELRTVAEVVYRPWSEDGGRGRLAEILAERPDINGLIIEADRVDADLLSSHPLKVIGVCRGDPVNVDTKAAAELGVPIFRTPGRNRVAVAELALAGVLRVLRRIGPAEAYLGAGLWGKGGIQGYLEFQGRELTGRSVGFVGFGAVGQAFARLLAGFECELRYYDPWVDETSVSSLGAHSETDVAAVMADGDVVSVHLPSRPDTKGFVSAELLRSMRPGSVFVNTARADVVDGAALEELVVSGHLGGAVLDVFSSEPLGHRGLQLALLPNVVATPHIGGATEDVSVHQAEQITDAVLRWVHGQDIDPGVVVRPIGYEREIVGL